MRETLSRIAAHKLGTPGLHGTPETLLASASGIAAMEIKLLEDNYGDVFRQLLQDREEG